MGTGSRGTFVISWSQTEVDGFPAATAEGLTVGATWRWTGQAVRVDAPGGLLRLEEAEGAADMRKRAARMVRRLVGIAVGPRGGARSTEDADAEEGDEQGFSVTDGRATYAVTLIEVPDTGARLLMFIDDVPPVDRDLWVVRRQVDRRPAAEVRAAGGVICFTPGARIATPSGSMAVEDLRPGDWVQTRDNGAQEILWAGSRRMTGARLYALPHLRPVRFRACALGFCRPDEDLLVSPRHRMLVKGAVARALFNTDEVLVAAEDLINDSTIAIDFAAREVTYVHLMLASHNILWANGLETESFHPAYCALDTIDPLHRDRLLGLMPSLAQDPASYGDPVRRNLTASEAAILLHEQAA